jgi:hypothetical protein
VASSIDGTRTVLPDATAGVINSEAAKQGSSTSDMAKLHGRGMTFLHLNVTSLLPKIPFLSCIFSQTKASILAVRETVRNFPCQTLKISKVSLVVMGS